MMSWSIYYFFFPWEEMKWTHSWNLIKDLEKLMLTKRQMRHSSKLYHVYRLQDSVDEILDQRNENFIFFCYIFRVLASFFLSLIVVCVFYFYFSFFQANLFIYHSHIVIDATATALQQFYQRYKSCTNELLKSWKQHKWSPPQCVYVCSHPSFCSFILFSLVWICPDAIDVYHIK